LKVYAQALIPTATILRKDIIFYPKILSHLKLTLLNANANTFYPQGILILDVLQIILQTSKAIINDLNAPRNCMQGHIA
jgi:hypothetical protein